MKISVNDKEFSLTPAAVTEVVGAIANMSDPNNMGHNGMPLPFFLMESFFFELYQSEDWKIRESVARGFRKGRGRDYKRTNLIINKLSRDSQIEVIRALVDNPNVRRLMKEKYVVAILKRKDSLAMQSVATGLEDFKKCNIDTLVTMLMENNDPYVKRALAANESTPVPFLEELCGNEDLLISTIADNTLELVREEEGPDDWYA